MAVHFALESCQHTPKWRFTFGFILEKSPMLAKNVVKLSLKRTTLNTISWFILERNHFLAVFVIILAFRRVILKNMWTVFITKSKCKNSLPNGYSWIKRFHLIFSTYWFTCFCLYCFELWIISVFSLLVIMGCQYMSIRMPKFRKI